MLKLLRDRHGLKQAELATRFGMSSSSGISDWENGKVIPQHQTLERYAEEFDVPVAKLDELRSRALLSKKLHQDPQPPAEPEPERVNDPPQATAAPREPDSPPAAGVQDRRRAWRPRARIVAAVVAVAVAAVLAVVLFAGGGGTHHGGAPGGGSRPPASSAASARTQIEYADNNNGSPVFAKPDGSHVVHGEPRIPFNTKVRVACKVPNTGAMTSVTAFYRIVGGRWNGEYVVSDTMSNGGPPGNADSPNVDPRVPRCSS
jgi:transcriptional regulator with XRE-family HTH domain